MSERDLWLVTIGDPPYHFGPFNSEGEAAEYREQFGGLVWPLWEPENDHAHRQDENTRGHFRSGT